MKFNSVSSYNPRANNCSYKQIKITPHSQQRAMERLNVTRKEELKKLASSARNKGINLNSIRRDTCEKLGLTWEEYCYLKGRFNPENNSTDIILHKGNVFVFCGKGQKTLKTVLNLNAVK